MIRDVEAEDDDTPAPQGNGREKLKRVAHYAMLGFAPVVSIVALCVVLFSGGNHSDRAQLSELNSRIDSLNASLSASREELENIKFSITREKSQRADERNKAEERDAKIIQNVTQLQGKLKIAPTLEEQLRVAARAQAVAPPVAATPVAPLAVSAPAEAGKMQAASAPVTASAIKKPAAAIPAPKVEEKKPAAAVPAKKAEEKKKAVPAPAPKAEEKMSPQVKALKKAIEQYNKE